MKVRYINGKLSLGRVLVVDDSITTRTLVQGVLEFAGYAVKTALNGVDALCILQSEAFDLVVADVNMPKMDGFELVRKIREDLACASLPVIMLTSQATFDSHKEGKDSGANAYIVKGNCNQTALLETVEKIMGS